jgi:hypothetical protein
MDGRNEIFAGKKLPSTGNVKRPMTSAASSSGEMAPTQYCGGMFNQKSQTALKQ